MERYVYELGNVACWFGSSCLNIVWWSMISGVYRELGLGFVLFGMIVVDHVYWHILFRYSR